MEKIESCIASAQHLMTLLTEVRGVYDLYLKPTDYAKLKRMSIEGTLSGCLKGVCMEGGGGEWVGLC